MTRYPGLFSGLLLAGTLHAQERARVSGTVIDSTRMLPVVGARVYAIPVATGGRLQAVTDAAGRFQFERLAVGHYLVDVRHERLDSLGVELPLRSLELRTPEDLRLDLGFPSARTVVAARCGADVEREGGGLIAGIVRQARTALAPSQASVHARWRSVQVDGGRIRRDSASVVATTDPEGRYLFCGLPSGAGVAIQAGAGDDSSGTISVVMPDERIVRRDLTVGPRVRRTATITNGAGESATTEVQGGAARLRGRVRDDAGNPVMAARVNVVGAGGEAISGRSGDFLLDSLPEGTYTLEARAIGFFPARVPVELGPNDTTQVSVTLQRVATVLDTVQVRSERVYNGTALAGVARRQRSGVGWHLGVEQIEKIIAILPTDYVFAAPGVFLKDTLSSQRIAMRDHRGNLCLSNILVDGVQMPFMEGRDLMEMAPLSRIVAVEVYARYAQIPAELPNAHNGCGLVAFWTGSRATPEANRK